MRKGKLDDSLTVELFIHAFLKVYATNGAVLNELLPNEGNEKYLQLHCKRHQEKFYAIEQLLRKTMADPTFIEIMRQVQRCDAKIN
jgi:hypothetical protein